jgi:hypothetical protein
MSKNCEDPDSSKNEEIQPNIKQLEDSPGKNTDDSGQIIKL